MHLRARVVDRLPKVSSSPLFVGVDVGTSSARAIAFDDVGAVVFSASKSYELNRPAPGRAELDPDEVLGATSACISSVCAEVIHAGGEIGAVSFSALMHSLMAVDMHGRPLTSLITWADVRALRQSESLRRRDDAHDIYARTGVPIHPMSPLAKLLWFKENDSRTLAEATRWLSLKEYLFLRLFDHWLTDASTASTTGLYNIRKGAWDHGLLDLIGLAPEKLAPVVGTTHVIEAPSSDLEIPAGTPVVVGATDGVLANLGVGVTGSGTGVCSVGTSGAVRATVPEIRTDPRGRTFCYALDEDRWVVGGPTSNGGVVLSWLLDGMLSGLKDDGSDVHEAFEQAAGSAPPGSSGLVFLPYLMGERAPHWNPQARAAFIGLTTRHGNPHVARAALEGIVMQLRSVATAVEEIGGDFSEIRATGGFASSEVWSQMMADAFRRPVVVAANVEGTALGAAILGMKAVGQIDSLERSEDMVGEVARYDPDPHESATYDSLFELFQDLYGALEGHFETLSRLEEG